MAQGRQCALPDRVIRRTGCDQRALTLSAPMSRCPLGRMARAAAVPVNGRASSRPQAMAQPCRRCSVLASVRCAWRPDIHRPSQGDRRRLRWLARRSEFGCRVAPGCGRGGARPTPPEDRVVEESRRASQIARALTVELGAPDPLRTPESLSHRGRPLRRARDTHPLRPMKVRA